MKNIEVEKEELQKTIEETQKREEQKKKKVKAVKIVVGIITGIAALGMITTVLLPNTTNALISELEYNLFEKTGLLLDINNDGIIGRGHSVNSYSDVKPIIYIYNNNTNNKNLKLSLTLDNIADKNSLVLYPLADKYTNIDNDSINLVWNITTNEDNTITASDNKEYSYIFWEAERGRIVDWNNTKGFCIKGEDTLEFLQSTLSEIGLTPKEYNEMIVYWLPLMKDNKYNLITFAGLDKNDIYYNTTKIELSNENKELDFNELRVFMITQPSDNYVDLEPQEFKTFNRNDNTITIVEWGGTQIKNIR